MQGPMMVVDDSDFFRSRMRHLFKTMGVRSVVEASSGKEAIALCHANRFSAIVLDIALPDVDGIDVLKVIKRLDPRAFVVMASAAASSAVVRQAKAAGADGFFVKPVDEAGFSDMVRQRFKSQALEGVRS